MTCNYLKKKKMYQIAKDLFIKDHKVRLCDCHYKFWRGSEWLNFHDDDFIYYELYAMSGGRHLTIEIFSYDDDLNRILIDRYFINGFGRMDYPIV